MRPDMGTIFVIDTLIFIFIAVLVDIANKY